MTLNMVKYRGPNVPSRNLLLTYNALLAPGEEPFFPTFFSLALHHEGIILRKLFVQSMRHSPPEAPRLSLLRASFLKEESCSLPTSNHCKLKQGLRLAPHMSIPEPTTAARTAEPRACQPHQKYLERGRRVPRRKRESLGTVYY